MFCNSPVPTLIQLKAEVEGDRQTETAKLRVAGGAKGSANPRRALSALESGLESGSSPPGSPPSVGMPFIPPH